MAQSMLEWFHQNEEFHPNLNFAPHCITEIAMEITRDLFDSDSDRKGQTYTNAKIVHLLRHKYCLPCVAKCYTAPTLAQDQTVISDVESYLHYSLR